VGLSYCLLRLGKTAAALGEYDLARQHFQEGLVIARETSDPSIGVESLMGQAMVASALEEHAQARQLLEKGLSLAMVPSIQLDILIGLGHATLALGEIRQSRGRFREALDLGVRTGIISQTLSALAGMAHLLAHEAEPERALELLALVLEHPATFQVTRDRAQRLLTQLESALSPEAVAAATARGQGRELEVTAAELLRELEAVLDSG
jgi:tetratricopeptide (TPR) repeat protein